jgi:hypothetical protein
LNRNVYKILLFSLSLINPFYLVSQSDTTKYVQSYYNAIVPRVLYTFKQQDIGIDNYVDNNTYTSEYFSTSDQHFIGGDISYKWITLGYGYGVNRENTSKNLDLRFATTYKPINLQANYTHLNNLTYTYLDTSFAEKQSFKPIGNEFYNYGVKIDYIFNYKKFCYSAGYTQGGKQLISKGSFIASAAFSENKFLVGDIPSNLDKDSVFFNTLKLRGINDWLGEVGFGYSYNWVIKKNLLIAVTELPCIGFQQLTLTSNESKSKTYFRTPFVNYFKLGAVWHIGSFFTGVSSNAIVRVSSVDNFDYYQVNVNANLHVGWVFPYK